MNGQKHALVHQQLPDGKWIGYDDGRLDCVAQWIRAHHGLFAGKSILDIGSNAGHFPLEYAKLTPPASIHAVEPRKQHVEAFRWLLDIVPIRGSIKAFTCTMAQFVSNQRNCHGCSVISCLGLLYHVKDFWALLAELIGHDTETLVLESQLWRETHVAHELGHMNESYLPEDVTHPDMATVEAEISRLGWIPERHVPGPLYEQERGLWVCSRK